jgi:hypothetical protein
MSIAFDATALFPFHRLTFAFSVAANNAESPGIHPHSDSNLSPRLAPQPQHNPAIAAAMQS